MKLKTAEILANRFIRDYCLDEQGWTFKFDNAKRRFGSCNYSKKVITLSKHLTLVNEINEVVNCILHEVAHALAPNCGHNARWQRIAIEIGCDGARCYDSNHVNTPESKYIATCHGCNKVYKRHKLSKRSGSCGTCSGKHYNENFKLNFKLNPNYK